MSRRDGDGGSSPRGRWVLTREAVRRLDALACERYAMPSIVLMENAAIGVARVAAGMLGRLGTRRVVILAGPGNNGGDGLALARHLYNSRAEVGVLLAAARDRYAGDAATNLAIIERMGLPIERLDSRAGAETLERSAAGPVLLVDALLGTGLTEAVRPPIRDSVLQINRLRMPGVAVLAVDVPSGLDCDSGEPAGGGAAVEADATVSFVALKEGYLRLGSHRWTGEVHVAGIGAPPELLQELGRFVPETRPGGLGGPGLPAPPADPPAGHGRAADRPGGRGG